MRSLLLIALLGVTTIQSHRCSGVPAAQGEDQQETKDMPGNLNLPLKTIGGTQFWTDHRYRDGYRIQQNSLTGHWRLLDPNDVRRAWGTHESCEEALDQVRPRQFDAAPRHLTVLLHGLMRTHHGMKPLAEALTAPDENGVAACEETILFAYASSRRSIGDHASALRELLEDLPAETEFSFVGHSMGNIVVRRLIGDLQRDGDPQHILPRCRSMVMLGPPNQGAAIARRLSVTGLFGFVTGPGGLELGPAWETFVTRLATPPFPFAIVAGDVSDNLIQNPLVDGAGDFIVSVEETKLEGADKVVTFPALHSLMMSNEAVIAWTVDYIRAH